MTCYRIPLWWRMCGELEIEADSLQEALDDLDNYELPD